MAHFSTGLGLAVLGGCILGAAAISSPRFGGEAFAQGTGGERRIVSTSIFPMTCETFINSSSPGQKQFVFAQRTWSDNSIDIRCIGSCRVNFDYGTNGYQDSWTTSLGNGAFERCPWRTLDNGTSGFRPLTDVDMSGETDAGDISQVLLDFNTSSDDLPPPPIDCTINAPR